MHTYQESSTLKCLLRAHIPVVITLKCLLHAHTPAVTTLTGQHQFWWLQAPVPSNELPELASPQTGIPPSTTGFMPLKNSIKLKLK